MNSDIPFIVTVKVSNIYDNNDRYNIINNIKNKELINCLREHIVFVNEGCGEYSAYVGTDIYRKLEKKYLKNMPVDDYYWYYMYLSYLERLNEI